MLEVTVKTLDGQNHKFAVPDDITVRQFKEKIANSIEIEADVQRLIFQGRVLADEKKINDYDVNGKTVHVVQRPPPSSRPQASGQRAPASSSSHHDDRGLQREANSFVLGSFSLPADAADPTHVQNMVHQMLSGMGDLGRGAHVTTQTTGNGSVDVHFNVGQHPPQSDAQNRISQASRMLNSAKQALNRLQNLSSADDNEATVEVSDDFQASSEAGRNASRSGTSEPSSESGTGLDANPQEGAAQEASGTQDPSVSSLSGFLADVLQFNEQFAPHLSRYQQLLATDPNLTGNTNELHRTQRLCDLTSETLHYMSHVYHNLSDLVVDMNQLPPRRLRAPPGMMPSQATAVIQQTIPVQAQISVAHAPVGTFPVSQPGGLSSSAESNIATPNTASCNTATTNQPGIAARAGEQMSVPANNTSSTNSGSFTARMASPWETVPPRFHIGVSSGAMPFPRPPAGFPPGFHMFVEMSQDGATAGTAQSSLDGAGQTLNQVNNTGTNTAANPPDGAMQFPPGDFIQNILQMAAGAALRGQPGQQVFVLSQGNMQPITVGASAVPRPTAPAPSTAPSSVPGSTSSAGASTTTTSSAPTSGATGTGNQGPIGGSPQRAGMFAGPRLSGIFASPQVTGGGLHLGGAAPPGIFIDPGFTSFGLIPPVDPYLPCHSRHFSVRRTNQPEAVMQTMEPQSLAGMMSNLVSSIITPPGAQPGAADPGRAAAFVRPTNPMASMSMTIPNLMTSATGIGRGTTEGESQVHMNSESNRNPSHAARAPPQSGAIGESHTSDEVISRLVQGISTQLTQAAFGQQANMSIASFLNSLGSEFNISQGEGLLTDLFNCITQHLVFSDLVMIFFGQVTPIERLRQPLQTFVSTNILNGLEATNANIDAAVNQLMANMEHDIEETAAATPSLSHIDYRASLTCFIRTHLTAAIRLIVNANDNGSFGQNIYDLCRLAVHEFLNLSRFCLRGGLGALDILVQNRLQAIAAEVNPAMQMSMVHMALQQLHQLLPTVSLRDEDIQQYVVATGDQETIESSAAAMTVASEASPQSTDSFETASGSGTDNTQDQSTEANPNTQHISEISLMDTSASVNGLYSGTASSLSRISPDLLSLLPPPPTQDDESQMHIAFESEDWHSNVPAVWVPVITRDVARQRRQAPQSSLSDAYLTGMPSKRRKVMTQSRHPEEFANVQVAIPESIRRAAQQVGSQPITSYADLSRDVAGSSQLHTAFQQELSEAIRRRIASDPDYTPNRFPNIEKFFNARK